MNPSEHELEFKDAEAHVRAQYDFLRLHSPEGCEKTLDQLEDEHVRCLRVVYRIGWLLENNSGHSLRVSPPPLRVVNTGGEE